MPWQYRYETGEKPSYENQTFAATFVMKSLLIIILAAVVATLYIGYYEKMEDAYPEKVFFIKKSRTFQIEFVNIFAYESDDKKLSELSADERHLVIQYCKYRLGMTSTLQSQSELDECKRR